LYLLLSASFNYSSLSDIAVLHSLSAGICRPGMGGISATGLLILWGNVFTVDQRHYGRNRGKRAFIVFHKSP